MKTIPHRPISVGVHTLLKPAHQSVSRVLKRDKSVREIQVAACLNRHQRLDSEHLIFGSVYIFEGLEMEKWSFEEDKELSGGVFEGSGDFGDSDMEGLESICDEEFESEFEAAYMVYRMKNETLTEEDREIIKKCRKTILSQLGYRFEVGDLVWGKVRGHPWWPGQIRNEEDEGLPCALNGKRDGDVLVSFFGDNTCRWLDPIELLPFGNKHADKEHQSTDQVFLKAVEEARNEAARRATVGPLSSAKQPAVDPVLALPKPAFQEVDKAGSSSGDVQEQSPLQDGVTRKRLVIRIPNPFKNRKPRESNEAKNEEAVDGQATSLEEYLHLKDALTVNKKKRGQRTKRSIFGFSQDCWQATFESRKDKGIADGYGRPLPAVLALAAQAESHADPTLLDLPSYANPPRIRFCESPEAGPSTDVKEGVVVEKKRRGRKRKESVTVQEQPAQAPRREDPNRTPNPAMLSLTFGPQDKIPSVAEMEAKLRRFGKFNIQPLIVWKYSTCQIVYTYESDARRAYTAVLNKTALPHYLNLSCRLIPLSNSDLNNYMEFSRETAAGYTPSEKIPICRPEEHAWSYSSNNSY